MLLKPPITVRIPATWGSAKAACKSPTREATDEELKSSRSSICSPKVNRRPSSAKRASITALVTVFDYERAASRQAPPPG